MDGSEAIALAADPTAPLFLESPHQERVLPRPVARLLAMGASPEVVKKS